MLLGVAYKRITDSYEILTIRCMAEGRTTRYGLPASWHRSGVVQSSVDEWVSTGNDAVRKVGERANADGHKVRSG